MRILLSKVAGSAGIRFVDVHREVILQQSVRPAVVDTQRTNFSPKYPKVPPNTAPSFTVWGPKAPSKLVPNILQNPTQTKFGDPHGDPQNQFGAYLGELWGILRGWHWGSSGMNQGLALGQLGGAFGGLIVHYRN